MKFEELKTMGLEESKKLEAKLRLELSEMKLKLRMGQVANTSKVNALKKDIARILTSRNVKKSVVSEGAAS